LSTPFLSFFESFFESLKNPHFSTVCGIDFFEFLFKNLVFPLKNFKNFF